MHAGAHTKKKEKKKTHTAVVSLRGATSILCEHEYLIGLPPQSSQFIMLYWAVSAQLHAAPCRACAAISFTAASVAQCHWRQIISLHLRCCFCFFTSCVQRWINKRGRGLSWAGRLYETGLLDETLCDWICRRSKSARARWGSARRVKCHKLEFWHHAFKRTLWRILLRRHLRWGAGTENAGWISSWSQVTTICALTFLMFPQRLQVCKLPRVEK